MSYEVKDLSFSYGDHKVLNDVSFDVQLNEMLCIIGPNGVGKSTLFKCMLGILNDYEGEALVCHKRIKDMSARELAKRVAYIPQSQTLSFGYSVLDMVLMGTAARMRTLASPGRKQEEIARESLKRVGIEDLADRNYLEISGGERQLVLVARALAQQAKVLIMDEPTSNLDFGNQLRIMEQMKTLTKEGYTVIMSTHNPEQAYLFADKVLAIFAGNVMAYGTPKEVITEEIVKKLYNIDVDIRSLENDRMRVCVPKSI